MIVPRVSCPLLCGLCLLPPLLVGQILLGHRPLRVADNTADLLAAAVIGGPATVRQGFAALAEATQADEFMLVCDVFDPALRLRALDIAAAAARSG